MKGFLANILKSNIRLFLAMAALVLAAYSFMLFSPFKTLDDDFSIVKNADIRSLGNIPQFFRSTYFKADQDYYRPLVYVTYAVEYHFFGLNYLYYNLDNVILHILNAWLVFCLVLGLLSAASGPGRKDDESGGQNSRNATSTGKPGNAAVSSPRTIAAAVALLFAIHPIHWEAVGNISGRAILLCAFFVLLGLISFLKFRREGRWAWLGAALLCYALGLCAKESAGVLILTLTAFVALVERPRGGWRTKAAAFVWTLPFGFLAAGYLLLRHAMGISKMFPWPSKSTMVLGQVSFLKGILIYLQLFLMPLELRFDRGLPIFQTFQAPAFWLTLVAWSAILVSLWRFRRKLSGLPLFCLAWFFIELAPVSQIVTTIGVYPGAISLAEHFVYVASVPIFILIVLGIYKLISLAQERQLASSAVIRIAVAGLYAFFYVMLVQQNLYASNEIVMLRDSLAKDPNNSRLQYSMGMVYAKAHNYPLAVEHFRRAVELHGCNYSYHIALGKALSDNGELLAAAREYESIPPRKDVNVILNANKTAVYRLLAEEYRKKVAADPADPALHFALGVFYSKLSEHAPALAEYRKAVELKPDHFDALYNIAVTCEGLGARDEARAAYLRLKDSPDSSNTHREQASAALERFR